jgi:integrase/recombinase XerD
MTTRDVPSEVWGRIKGFLSMKSPLTNLSYKGILREWCDFLGILAFSPEGAQRFLDATDLDALSYRSWLYAQEGHAPRLVAATRSASLRDGTQSTLTHATVAKKLSALRRLYRVIDGLPEKIQPNPFDRDTVEPPSAHSGRKRPTEMVDFSLVKSLIETPSSETPKGVRDRALLAILFGGGLRRSEAVGLRIGDVKKTPQGTLYLTLRSTKARRDAEQALPEWVEEYLNPYLQYRYVQQATVHHYLFITFTGKGGNTPVERPLSASGVYELFKRYAHSLPGGLFLSPHSARATAITKLLSDGVSYREVKEFSRHGSVTMVEVYDKRRLGVENNPGKKLKY